MIFARPRFGVALIEEADLSKSQPELDVLIDEIGADHKPSVILLLLLCTPEVMKVEFQGLADRLSTPELPVLVVPASGLEYTFSQAEDVLQALIPFCPTAPADDRRVVFLGSVNDTIADDFALEAARLGIPVAGFLPASHFHELPPIGPCTVLAPLSRRSWARWPAGWRASAARRCSPCCSRSGPTARARSGRTWRRSSASGST